MARRKEIADTHFVQQMREQQEEPNSFSVPLCPVANLEQSFAENEARSRIVGEGGLSARMECAARRAVELKFSSHPERVEFAQILLDLTGSFAPLNRVINHYQHVFGS
jgi:hypothetical protein